MTHVIDRPSTRGRAGSVKQADPPLIKDSPYERARKRLEDLSDPTATPQPPPEVLALKSTRALEDWEDLMLVQDVELWGAVDLTIAAQLVCLQELVRDMQFEVQSMGRMFEFDRWGTQHLSSQFRMWQAALGQVNKLRQSIGFDGTARERSTRDANRRAKKAIRSGAEAIKKASEPTTPLQDQPPPLLAGSDITA